MLFSECALCNAISFVMVIFSIVYIYFEYSYNYWKKLDVPYLRPTFPFGNCYKIIMRKEPFGVKIGEFYKELKTRGYKYGGIYFFNKPVFIPVCPDLIKQILSKDFEHFHDRGVYHNEESSPLSAHLFTLSGQKWKNLRAKFTPTFSSGKLKQMFATLLDCSLELKNCLNEPIEKHVPININRILTQYTTDVIGSCAFGIECNSFKNPNTEFIRNGETFFCPNLLDRMKFFFTFTFPEIAKLLKMRSINKNIESFYRNMIKSTVEYRINNNITRNDFMHLLIQLKTKGYIEDEDSINKKTSSTTTTLTLNELSAQSFLFFLAGLKTSSTAMTWCIFELSQNHQIQDKLRTEIIRVVRKHDNQITYDAVSEMHFFNCVINESLRKYPSFLVLLRKVTKDYNIPDTSITLKKGTSLLIPIFGIQRDPDYYPDPDKFDPDRFKEKNQNPKSDYTWLPFGKGPRTCLGQRFAVIQMKVGLCQLLLNYKFSLNSNTKLPIIFNPYSSVFEAQSKILVNAEKIIN